MSDASCPPAPNLSLPPSRWPITRPTPRRVVTPVRAANLFREAAHACLDLEADEAAELISAGSVEIAKATELIAASTSGVAG